MKSKRIFRTILITLLVMAMVTSFAACTPANSTESSKTTTSSQSSETTQTTGAPVKEYKILLNSGDKLSEFAQTFVAGCQKAISEITDIKIIGINEASETADVPENSSIIDQAVAQGYDGIISMPYSGDAFEEAYKRAWAKGVPTVAWHVPPVEGTVAISYCGPDAKAYSELAVEFTVKELEKKGITGKNVKIVIMTPGIDDQSAKQGEWVKAKCEAMGVTFVTNNANGIEPAKQMEQVSGVLQGNPDANGWIAMTATSANSASKVLQENGLLDKVVVVGIDCTPSNCQDVKDGKVAGLIDQGGYMSGYNSVMILADWFRNNGKLTKYTKLTPNPTKIAVLADMPTYDAINVEVIKLVESLKK